MGWLLLSCDTVSSFTPGFCSPKSTDTAAARWSYRSSRGTMQCPFPNTTSRTPVGQVLFAGACERTLAASFCKKQSSTDEDCLGLLSWVMGYAQSVLDNYWGEGSLMLRCGVILFVASCLSFDVGVDASSGV